MHKCCTGCKRARCVVYIMHNAKTKNAFANAFAFFDDERMNACVADAVRSAWRQCLNQGPSFPYVVVCGVYSSSGWHHCTGCKGGRWGNPEILYVHRFCMNPIHCMLATEIQKDEAQMWQIFLCQACLAVTVAIFCITRLQDTWLLCLFALQKLNMAMPPCHPSSAVERGKAWKGKAKARKTQVAGKGYWACCSTKKKCLWGQGGGDVWLQTFNVDLKWKLSFHHSIQLPSVSVVQPK